MKNKFSHYIETHPLQLNVYLLFYVYVFILLIIANCSPVGQISYFIFLFFGITGVSLLFIKAAYKILIEENKIEVSVKIIFKIRVLQLKMKEIESMEEVINKENAFPFQTKKNVKLNYKAYLPEITEKVRITTKDYKTYIIPCNSAIKLISLFKQRNVK